MNYRQERQTVGTPLHTAFYDETAHGVDEMVGKYLIDNLVVLFVTGNEGKRKTRKRRRRRRR